MKRNRTVVLHLYAGIELSKKDRQKAMISVILDDKDHFYHYALLSALDYGVQSISRISNQKYEIDYYPNNDLIYFEYEKEYRQDKCFSASTRDIDLWNHIVNILNTSKCELTIEPRFSTLSMLGKIEKQGGAFDE